MAKYKIESVIYIEGDHIETDKDALNELQIMVDDYDSNNPYCADIIIHWDKIIREN